MQELLERSRERLSRLDPQQAHAAMGAGGVLVDIRSESQIQRDGSIPGALVISRNVLEWRLDPASAHRHAEAPELSAPVIIICHEGYQSSLAAATLQELGFSAATDVVGGFLAWRTAGLPVAAWDGE